MHQRTEREIMNNWKDNLDVPLVSVCCTTYNHELYISQAIDGFLMQETNFPFEILIRDDCSTDKTASIVKEYADKYPSLIKPVFEKENTFSKGVKPMPQLYKISKGKYIALCEGDDYWTDPLKLQRQVDFLEENDEYALCYTGATLLDDNGVVLNENKQFGDSTQDELIAGMGNAITGSVVFRKIDFNEFSNHDVKNGDSFLWHILGFYGKCKLIKNIKNTVYRIHDGGIWSGRSEQSKLVNSLKTYTVIRNNIIRHFGKESSILKEHDTIYGNIFIRYFYTNLRNFNLTNCLFGLKELVFFKSTNKPLLYIFIFKRIFAKVLLK